MISVFLVDDHEIVRRGLSDLLRGDRELSVVGEAGSVSQALARIPALWPDVAILDVRLPDGNGIELCRDLLSTVDGLHCLMLTSFTDEHAMTVKNYVSRLLTKLGMQRRTQAAVYATKLHSEGSIIQSTCT